VRGPRTAPGKCVFPADCTRRTRTLPRIRSTIVLPTAGDPRRIRSLQPVQPVVLLLTAGHPCHTHSLLPVQPAVLFTRGGRSAQNIFILVTGRRMYTFIIMACAVCRGSKHTRICLGMFGKTTFVLKCVRILHLRRQEMGHNGRRGRPESVAPEFLSRQ
jgi:hypothetical protein